MELTGHTVESRSFQMLRDDDVHGWLGASPDGLIEGLVATPGTGISIGFTKGFMAVLGLGTRTCILQLCIMCILLCRLVPVRKPQQFATPVYAKE